jgi:hypothetical protein
MPASPGCSRSMKRSSCVVASFFLDDGVADVRPVEAADELVRVFELQPLDDVGAGQRVGGGGQRDARHARVALVQHGQRPVLGPEVVAPLAHAVRLVDREQAQGARWCRSSSRPRKRGVFSRSGAAYSSVRRRSAGALDVLGGVPVERGVQEGGRHAGFVERADLVVHQRDQRRDHQMVTPLPGALAGDGRNLVAQALAAAGGHQHQRVAAGGDVVDDRGLRPRKAA